jgi:glycosyltransferase involved in cell wall biosynthesis
MADSSIVVWEQVKIPLFALSRGFDVLHCPYNTRSLLAPGMKTITTVHDLTFLNKRAERDAKSALIHWYMYIAFWLGTRHSDALIAVSDTTKSALHDLGIVSSRIYNTVDKFLSIRRTPSLLTPRPYILHRGSYAQGHRNTERTIRAFLSQPELASRYVLKILGTPEGAKRWQTTADQPIEYLPRVSDEELASLYAGASCVVAASLLEGFCLPIVEAFGFGCPVITSNINPMLEIARDAALLVNPESQEQIAEAMLKIVSDEALEKDLVERGKSRLRLFRREVVAEEYISVYRSVLDRGNKVTLHPLGSQSTEYE